MLTKSQPTLFAKNEGYYMEEITNKFVAVHFSHNSCWKNTWNDTHYHNEYIEILYTETGDFSIMIDGNVYDTEPGSIFIIKPGETHATRKVSDDPNARLMCLRFIPEILYTGKPNISEFDYTLPQIFDFWGINHYLSPDVVAKNNISGEFAYLKQEEKARDFSYILTMRSSAIRIFAQILRYWHQASVTNTHQINYAVMNMLQQIKDYVDENYQTVTLHNVSKELNLSYSYLSRLFNRYMDMSFNDYVNLVRINHSVKALSTTERTITDIALEFGFSSPSHYIQTFRKFKNISPNKFRKQFWKP